MGLILDTSILIAAEKQRFLLSEFFANHPTENFCIAAITAAELLHGVERASPPERKAHRSIFVERMLANLQVLEFDLSAARRHARLWASLEQTGHIIGPYDLLIAATALECDYGVATLNTNEFQRVPGLRLMPTQSYFVPKV